jgi:nucleoside-triphosphatase
MVRHSTQAAHILITGLPGVGKTTLIRGLATRLAKYDPAGFYTEEIRDSQGKREGFRIVTLSGRRWLRSYLLND